MSLATDLYVPARWREVVAWIDVTSAGLSVDTVGFTPPGKLIVEGLALRDSVHELAADAVVQQCLNSQGLSERRSPALDTDTGWPGSVPGTASPAATSCLDMTFTSRLAASGDLPIGGARPDIDLTAYLDAIGVEAITGTVECAREHGEVNVDVTTDLLGAFGQATGVILRATASAMNATPSTTAPATPPNPSEAEVLSRAARLCPTLLEARSAVEHADELGTRAWMAAHPDTAAAIVAAYRHDLGVYRDVLANDLEYVGALVLDDRYVGVAMRDQGAGICLMTDEFYNSAGCDSVAQPQDGGPLDSASSSSAGLVYGFVRVDGTAAVTVDGAAVTIRFADPVAYGSRTVKMFAGYVPEASAPDVGVG